MTYFVVSKSSATSGTPGANIEDASGVSNVRNERTPILVHFFLAVL